MYEMYIDENNILQYYNLPINLFVQALVQDSLNKFFRYTVADVRKDRKKSVRRKIKN